ncbi:EF-hand domain-containing protein [Actinomadura harenae]|uniref:EF-hand domain-containing protein n=1 Tax=Actinomadura harenae TaxID=2483351 RepID=A0A3M2MDQ7_9ACTN|nr:EF-hand domain-containing protein [Actinomadura harenae]RMI47854.1 EF-hand domain-containing protein [Actinomadura harenae]
MADEETITDTEAAADGQAGAGAQAGTGGQAGADGQAGAGGPDSLLGQAEATFKALDSDADGFVTRDELRTSYKNFGLDLPEAALDHLMSADTDGDGRIDLEEWLRSVDQAAPVPSATD